MPRLNMSSSPTGCCAVQECPGVGWMFTMGSPSGPGGAGQGAAGNRESIVKDGHRGTPRASTAGNQG